MIKQISNNTNTTCDNNYVGEIANKEGKSIDFLVLNDDNNNSRQPFNPKDYCIHANCSNSNESAYGYINQT